jgi:hypothetical protein
MTRGQDLNELATLLSTAIEKARRLELPTSVYILSMARMEVSQASKVVADDEEEDDLAR